MKTQLERILDGYDDGRSSADYKPGELMSAGREAARKGDELGSMLRGKSLRSVANLSIELDQMADLFRQAASNLRNVAQSELRHRDSSQANQKTSKLNARTKTELENPK